MRCPYCATDDDRVIDSRAAGEAIRRRRACNSCGQRFSTYERVEQTPLRVRKRSGDVEAFDRDKVAKGIARATTNLPLEPGAVRRAVARVEGRLRDSGRREVTSDVVGGEVLAALRELHDVAYMRFASVYKSFTSPEDFHRELASLSTDDEPPEPASTP
ncbi:transcriptional repressor NrdR [Egibacter rhizosphaerae]|uniref:Transcriptional repressor NrdR n=1 Tax=Egibacter rhizosphaerae TaxID=1670831 RepID=A0A411YJA6_9ACTN|nr:transcriptional regulator NrdR [Egibacter rhizosphaerae]QBI21293.1 transcriptional repressor NrdR [Egibacter rhizosphaerae]